jgi:hypothetical protein
MCEFEDEEGFNCSKSFIEDNKNPSPRTAPNPDEFCDECYLEFILDLESGCIGLAFALM